MLFCTPLPTHPAEKTMNHHSTRTQKINLGLVHATSWITQESWFECRQEYEILYSILTRPGMELTQPPIYGESAALSTGVKGLGREADHKLPSTAESKNDWIYIYTPPSAFIAGKEKTSLYMGDYFPDSSLFLHPSIHLHFH